MEKSTVSGDPEVVLAKIIGLIYIRKLPTIRVSGRPSDAAPDRIADLKA